MHNESITVQGAAPSWDFKRGRFLLRLALAYALVPLTAPALMVLDIVLNGQRLPFFDALGMVLLYAVFGFGAMVVLGLPLLFLYARLRWTSFVAFIGGGAVCAAVTYVSVVRGQTRPDQFAVFSAFGLVEGLFLRLILFGAGRGAPSTTPQCARMS